MKLPYCSRSLAAALALSSITGCGKKDEAADSAPDEAKPILNAEDQQNDRQSRRDRLKRERELYLARLKKSAREYSEEQSAPEVEKNLEVFKIRSEGYIKESYTPELKSQGLTPRSFPTTITPVDSNLKALGVNFHTGDAYKIPQNHKAGVPALEHANWNNLTHAEKRADHNETLSGKASDLKLANGQTASSLELSWQAKLLSNRGNNPQQDAPGNLFLMSGNLEGDDLTLSLKGLSDAGFTRYDLVIYLEYVLDENQQDGDQQPISRVDLWSSPEKKSLIASDLASAVKVSGAAYPGQIRSFTRQQGEDRILRCVNTGKAGHFVYFANLSSPEIFFQVTGPVFGKFSQFRLAGLQVIQRP